MQLENMVIDISKTREMQVQKIFITKILNSLKSITLVDESKEDKQAHYLKKQNTYSIYIYYLNMLCIFIFCWKLISVKKRSYNKDTTENFFSLSKEEDWKMFEIKNLHIPFLKIESRDINHWTFFVSIIEESIPL